MQDPLAKSLKLVEEKVSGLDVKALVKKQVFSRVLPQLPVDLWMLAVGATLQLKVIFIPAATLCLLSLGFVIADNTKSEPIFNDDIDSKLAMAAYIDLAITIVTWGVCLFFSPYNLIKEIKAITEELKNLLTTLSHDIDRFQEQNKIFEKSNAEYKKLNADLEKENAKFGARNKKYEKLNRTLENTLSGYQESNEKMATKIGALLFNDEKAAEDIKAAIKKLEAQGTLSQTSLLETILEVQETTGEIIAAYKEEEEKTHVQNLELLEKREEVLKTEIEQREVVLKKEKASVKKLKETVRQIEAQNMESQEQLDEGKIELEHRKAALERLTAQIEALQEQNIIIKSMKQNAGDISTLISNVLERKRKLVFPETSRPFFQQLNGLMGHLKDEESLVEVEVEVEVVGP